MKRNTRKAAVLTGETGTIREQLARLVAALIDPDEGRRQHHVQILLFMCPRPVLSRLIDGLVEVLGRRNITQRRQAVASLVQIGSPTLPALTLALVKRRSVAVKLAAAKAITAIAPRLDPEKLLGLQYDAMIALEGADDDSVRLALVKLLAVLRHHLESRPGSVVVDEGATRTLLALSEASAMRRAVQRKAGRAKIVSKLAERPEPQG